MEGRDAAKEASRGVFFSIFFDRQSHLRRRLWLRRSPNARLREFPLQQTRQKNGQHNCPISADPDRFSGAAQGAAGDPTQIF
jgi:hypothetical protein